MSTPLPPSCPPKSDVPSRPLMDVEEAQSLERLFSVLASDTRLRLLHALMIQGDPCMGDLAKSVGMKPPVVSNQLRRLVEMGILATRRHGNHIHYRIVDNCITKVLYHGLCLNEEARKHLKGSRP